MSQSTSGRHLASPPGRGPSDRGTTGRSIALVVLIMVVALAGGFGAYLYVNRPSSAGNCGSGTLTLQVVADPDQSGLLQQAARDYASTKPVVNDRCVAVNVRGLDSPEATAALGTGWTDQAAGPRPDVWVPAASTWASELELQLQQARSPDILPVERPSVATSPLVIAMPKPMAQALGWPWRQLGWGDLSTALRNPAGWAAFGHPEWGSFKLGKTDPKLSEAGLGALLGAGIAVVGQNGRQPTQAELASKAPELGSMILEVSRSPGDETDTTSTLLANLQRADEAGKALTYISAVPLTEKSVWDYNQGRPIDDPSLGTERPKPKVPLAAIYPKEGTLQADYPWLVLREPWVDDAKRAAASDFLLYLKSPTVQGGFQAAGFRSARGQPGAEIDPDSGLLPDQPKRVMATPGPLVLGATLKAWDQTKRIANLLAVYDVSGSMGEVVPGTGGKTKMDLAKQAAMASLRLFTSESDVGTWEFSTNLDGRRDYRQAVAIAPVGSKEPGGGTHLQRLQQRLVSLAPTHGDTGLYDTALAAYDYVKQHYAPDRLNLVVLLTDGRNDDPGGGISLEQLVQHLRDGQKGDRKVRFISFAYGKDADVNALDQISKATGGAVFASPNPADIERVFVTALAKF
jgi:Ca-activated chloride channel family protein